MEKARLRPGRGFQLDRAVLYYCQRVVVLPRLRWTLATIVAFCVSIGKGRRGSQAQAGARAEIVGTLQERGVCEMGCLLGREQIADIRAYLADKATTALISAPSQPGEAEAPFAITAYDSADIIACPHVMALANAEWLLDIARAYLGCPPTLSGMTLRWSFPVETPPVGPQEFHRDFADWRVVSLFVYLTDVGERHGPHIYLHGSHRGSAAAGGREAAPSGIVLTGPAGFGFLADNFGIHRAAPPQDGARLILKLSYSVLPNYAYLYRRRPASAAFDRYTNRLFLE